jgi:hypothetical protein
MILQINIWDVATELCVRGRAVRVEMLGAVGWLRSGALSMPLSFLTSVPGLHQVYGASCLQWTQNNCELRKRHSKRGKKIERARGSTAAKSLWKHLLLTAVFRCTTSAAWTCFTSYNTRKGLCSLSVCAIVLRSSPPSHVSTCNGQRSSQLFCVHYTGTTSNWTVHGAAIQ